MIGRDSALQCAVICLSLLPIVTSVHIGKLIRFSDIFAIRVCFKWNLCLFWHYSEIVCGWKILKIESMLAWFFLSQLSHCYKFLWSLLTILLQITSSQAFLSGWLLPKIIVKMDYDELFTFRHCVIDIVQVKAPMRLRLKLIVTTSLMKSQNRICVCYVTKGLERRTIWIFTKKLIAEKSCTPAVSVRNVFRPDAVCGNTRMFTAVNTSVLNVGSAVEAIVI